MQNKKKNLKSLSPVVKMFFKTYKLASIVVLFCIIFAAASQIASSVFIQQITSLIETTLKTQSGIEAFNSIKPQLFNYLTAMIAIFIFGIICSAVSAQIMARVGQGFLNKVRVDMFNKMESLPVKFFDRNQHGDIMSHYTNDVDTLRQFICQSLPQCITTFLTIVFAIAVMLSYSLWLFLIVVIGTIVMLFVTTKLGGKSASFFMKQQVSTGIVEGYIEEMMHGAKVVKVFSHESAAKEDFDKINDQLFNDARQANHFANILMPILGNIGHIQYSLISIMGVVFYITGLMNVSFMGVSVMSLAIIVAFLPLSRQFSQNVSNLSQQVSMIAMAMAGTSRILEFLNQESEVDEGYVTLVNVEDNKDGSLIETTKRTNVWAWKHPHSDGTITYTKLTGDIVLEGVDFGYYPEKIVLHDVDIYARPGQKIAFVGATGAGKTTITNLINRFYDIADGKIRYDGININKIKKDDLRRSLGIVLQDTNLFTGTVMENIRYGRLDASDEDVYNAAKIANAYDFITRLPEGFQTMLSGDGANLSQGQRQLISIARAACADAPVMILDEATSSIDTRTEALVQRGTDQLMKGRTVFVIAHRLSTVQNSDCIMVLDHGRIIERGSHDDLINEKGTYYQLYTGAFELE